MDATLLHLIKLPLIENLILQTPGVFNYSPDSSIEIAPKAFTPIYINFEIFTYYPSIRRYIIELLRSAIPANTDIICGIESGGSYFASALADQLNKPLILLRKENKTNDYLSRIVGRTPSTGQRICLVDDVFSTGTTAYRAQKYFQPFDCRLTVRSVFTFGHEKEIGQKIGLNVRAVSFFSTVLKMAVEQKFITPADRRIINAYVRSFANYLETKKIIC